MLTRFKLGNSASCVHFNSVVFVSKLKSHLTTDLIYNYRIRSSVTYNFLNLINIMSPNLSTSLVPNKKSFSSRRIMSYVLLAEEKEFLK